MKKLVLIAIVTLFFVQCSKKVSPPPSVGESAFSNTCKKCHGLPKPAKHTAEEWVPIMNRMQEKAHFSDGQKEQILSFLSEHAKK